MFKKTLSILLSCIALTVSVSNSAQANLASESETQQQIEQLLASIGYVLPLHIGIKVQSMQTGKVLYEKNADHLFTPASVQKLFTAVAALSHLGPNFHYNTSFLTNASLINSEILNGDL